MSIKLSDVNYTYMKDTPFEKTGIKIPEKMTGNIIVS